MGFFQLNQGESWHAQTKVYLIYDLQRNIACDKK